MTLHCQITTLILLYTTSLSGQGLMKRTGAFMKKEDALQHKYYIKRSKKLTKFSFSMKRGPLKFVLQALKSARELRGDGPEVKKN